MQTSEKSLMGGGSSYCISEGQLTSAFRLANDDPESAPKIQKVIEEIEASLSRNEQAALAFVIIERLRAHRH
jgi:hypothetical protein